MTNGGGAPVRARSGAQARLAPVHGSLPVLAEERFGLPLEAHRVVTFLNRALKRRGLVFGLSQEGDEVRLRIYLSEDHGAQRKDGEASDDDHSEGDRR